MTTVQALRRLFRILRTRSLSQLITNALGGLECHGICVLAEQREIQVVQVSRSCYRDMTRALPAGTRTWSSISTVAVMPADSTTPGGTSSIWIRTGMRWARRTQVKIGLTVATP